VSVAHPQSRCLAFPAFLHFNSSRPYRVSPGTVHLCAAFLTFTSNWIQVLAPSQLLTTLLPLPLRRQFPCCFGQKDCLSDTPDLCTSRRTSPKNSRARAQNTPVRPVNSTPNRPTIITCSNHQTTGTITTPFPESNIPTQTAITKTPIIIIITSPTPSATPVRSRSN
jgi:hypothetical protein